MNEILKRPEIQKILLTVLNNNWNTDYTIRYVTVELSKLVRRDISFFKADEEEKLKRVSNASYLTSYPDVICKSLHELIRDVLAYLGINSKVVEATNTRIPLYALVVDGEHGRYFIDALYDLFRSQHCIQPVTYGNIIHSNNTSLDESRYGIISLPLDYIREMDLDLGIIKDEYFSDYINRIKLDFTDRNKAKKVFETQSTVELLQKKVGYVSDNFLNLYPVTGPMERIGLYVYYRGQLFNKGEKEKFYVKMKDNDEHTIYLTIHYAGQDFIYEEVKEDGKYSFVPKHLVK